MLDFSVWDSPQVSARLFCHRFTLNDHQAAAIRTPGRKTCSRVWRCDSSIKLLQRAALMTWVYSNAGKLRR